MTNLPVKPGIDGLPTSSIPSDPNDFVDWFKNSFIPRWAANADIRNAIPGAAVSITGNPQTTAFVGIMPNGVTNEELRKSAARSVMGNPTGVLANVQDIVATADGQSLQRVGGVLVWAPAVPTITTADSITGLGSVVSPLELVGDALSPGNSQYYGTNGVGTKGFYPVPGANIQTFTQAGGTSQSYTVPSGAKVIQAIVIGGGGGGGSGGCFATSAGGGGGGGGGGIGMTLVSTALLGATVTLSFSSTAGGTGGIAQVPATANGNPGTVGATANFGGFLKSTGGVAGNGGTIGGAGSGGSGGTGIYGTGLAGGTSAIGGASPGTDQSSTAFAPGGYAPTGGGAGGSCNGGTPGIGAAGGGAGALMTLLGGAGGATSTNGSNGSNGNGYAPGSGAGGGGASTTIGGTGGNGGNYGTGGGGGGACLNTGTRSGAGGNGGPAAIILIAW